MKRVQGLNLTILFLYGILLSFSSSSYASSAQAQQAEADTPAPTAIEESWVEKKIAPPTQWIENLFAPFTEWMESGIQRTPEPSSRTSAPDKPANTDVISIRQAIAVVLEHHPGKILLSRFKTGPPPHYQIKVLSDQGNVSVFYIHAFSGQLFLPELAAPAPRPDASTQESSIQESSIQESSGQEISNQNSIPLDQTDVKP